MNFTFSKTSQPIPKPLFRTQPRLRRNKIENMFATTQKGPCSQCPTESRRIPYVPKK